MKGVILIGLMALVAGAFLPTRGTAADRDEQFYSFGFFDFCQGPCTPDDDLCCDEPE